MATNERTLVLSQGYEPVRVVSWQRAITMISLGKVEIIEEYDGFIRSTSVVVKVPAVVRLINAFRRVKKPVKFSRINIYGRDGYKCQYCGNKERMGELTYDHVLPKSRGGKTSWTNIVTCCYECNSKKRDRTPQEARMKLLSEPVRPKWVPAVAITVSRVSVPDAWRDYLYWTGSLLEGE
jgi:5-methylcytosine-specific restriction endonuclease McrA